MGKQAQTRREKKEQQIRERKEFLRAIGKKKNPFADFWLRADFWLYAFCLVLIVAFPFLSNAGIINNSTASAQDKNAIIHTSSGDIEIELYTSDAPKTVENFTKLAQKGYYDNLTWHRVIKGFMIQGGDPTGDGTGGESAFGDAFEDEINPKSLGLEQSKIDENVEKGYKYNYSLNSHKMSVGSIAMANSGPNTNGSQFFIVTEQDQPHLDGQHTVFGQVTKGLEIAKAISEVPVDENDKPVDNIYITSVEIK